MNKKIISFINPNFSQGPKELNAYYLPYSVGVLWSYVNQFEFIQENYELGEVIWKREKIDDVADRLKNHDIVGFSCYIWNAKYCYELSKRLKKLNPKILIIFGGPEPAIEKIDFFKNHPYIDVCVVREGEITLKNLLESFVVSDDFRNINGLVINNNGLPHKTGITERISDLDTIPSPYLNGFFDKIIKDNPECIWNATVETNRGCPYMCTFCDWGSLTYSKIKVYGLDRVFDELEWVGKNKCDYISFTDANFGIFEERDSMIADKLIEVQNKYNAPRNYAVAWAKNQKKSVIEIVRKLINYGKSRIGLNLSVQSLDDGVLSAIKRKNLQTNKIEEVFLMCEKNGIPLYTEVILGLPGETLETFKETLYKLFRINNHSGISVYQAQLLENSEMNLSQRLEYKIEGALVYDYLYGYSTENEVMESIEVVTSTKDLPREDMIAAQVYSWFLNTFHIDGITSFISRFLYNYYNIDYSEFYEKLFLHIQKDKWLNDEVKSITVNYKNWTDYGKIDYPPIGNMEVYGFNLIHSTIAKIQLENKYEHVFSIVEDFVKTNFNIGEEFYDELIDLQRNYFIDYNKVNTYPKTVEYKYDILGFVQENLDLNKHSILTYDFPENKEMSLLRFCENLYFGRRRNFGKAWINKK
jgi:radical SAM superfamily enzyme YgiQ (UPF0313 family)